MDWLFRPLGRFLQWSIQLIEWTGMNFNRVVIVIGGILILYWLVQMYKQRKNDKGFFRKAN